MDKINNIPNEAWHERWCSNWISAQPCFNISEFKQQYWWVVFYRGSNILKLSFGWKPSSWRGLQMVRHLFSPFLWPEKDPDMMRKMEHSRLTIIMEEEDWTGSNIWVRGETQRPEKRKIWILTHYFRKSWSWCFNNKLLFLVFVICKNMLEYAVFVKFNCCQI